MLKKPLFTFGIIALLYVFFSAIGLTGSVFAVSSTQGQGERLLVIHDGTVEQGILTSATTVREAFEDAGIPVDENDLVEPGLDETLIASSYDVNVYRARPVTIVDGAIRKKIMSAYRTPKQIVTHAGMELRDEDITTTSLPADLASGGAALQLTIDRATPFTFVLYGKKTTAYTQAETVVGMLKEKGITLGENDVLSVDEEARLVTDMTVELWRNGKQTITEDIDIPFEVERVKDVDRPVGYREVKTPGEPGKRTVTYEVEMKNGVEISRTEINSVTTKQPVSQIEAIGVKPNGSGLTKAKGVMNYTDSNGVTHRETYYDLPMRVVMGNCGAGGFYSVREDGAKVDRDGYIIVAAHLGNYPRCTVVETSLGPGKVYDTGGFAQRHPHGFDLATDWTNYDGI